MNTSYDAEADWLLLSRCNFRCPYCFFSPADRSARIITYATPSEWLEGFNATGRSWLLHITGGEPSIYPDFVGLCEQLTQNHILSINTNLSHRSADSFCERIDPERVHFINAALHYDQRPASAPVNVFIERVLRLQARGFAVLVSAVMTPEMIGVFAEAQRRFEASGIFIIPKVMRGWYRGRRYPGSYTEAEKALIREYLAGASLRYASLRSGMGEPPTINMFTDDDFLNGVGSYRGKLCASGVRFVRIDSDGSVVRCDSRERLGNILQKNVNLLSHPQRCDSSYCPYFCAKYTSPPYIPRRRDPYGSFVNSLSCSIRRGEEQLKGYLGRAVVTTRH